jgi:hypothetical protein
MSDSGLQGGNLVLRRTGGVLLLVVGFALDMFGKLSPACAPGSCTIF